jgi:glycine C-acetyltransferase/8-amino-7-oxononanoate synthase
MPIFVVGTLGKSLGSYGAYVCCDRPMAKYLVNTARSLIFSTALPPPAVAGALAALEILVEHPERVLKLQRNARLLADALADEGIETGSQTQILPLVVGSAEAAVKASERLLERGIFAQAIRPPTVPAGTSRLRLAVMASHSASELKPAAREIARIVNAEAPQRSEVAFDFGRPATDEPPARVFDHLSEAA